MTELPFPAEEERPAPLGRRVMTAVAFAGTARLVVQVTSWLMTLVVIRLLTPADYGLMGLVSLFTGFVAMFNELGMGAALVQTRRVTGTLLAELFGLVLLLQILFGLLILVTAAPVADFFGEPRLVPMLQVQSLQFLFYGFAVVPDALLMRRLDFQRKSLVETVAALLASGATLLLAFTGFGVWALIDGVLLGAATRALGLTWITRFLPMPRLRLSGLGGLVRFGGLLTAERLLWFGYTRFDAMIIGKRFGPVLLGDYTVAMTLASLPLDKLGPVLTQVSFPAFAEVQERPGEATAHLLKAVRLLSLLFFPLLFGLAAVASDAVPLLLGAQWTASVVPLTLVSLVMPLRMINLVIPSYLKGLGHPGASLLTIGVACLILPAALLVGSRWGLAGIGAAWLFSYPVFFLASLSIAGRVTPLRIAPVLAAIVRPALAASLMLLLLWLAQSTLLAPLAPGLRLPLAVAFGIACYALAILLLDRSGCSELLGLLRHRAIG
jgi:O-antigen/teichoic acid export membrane protein